MMKYIYLVLAIICFSLFVYFFLGNRLNRRLNIKKRQMAINPNKNKYTKLMFISICLFFVFGMLFVIKVVSRDYDELKTIDNGFNYQESLKLDKLNNQKISNSIEYTTYNQSLEDDNIVYLIENNYIVKFDVIAKKSNKVLINEEYQVSSIYQNNSLIVCIGYKDNTSRVDIISKYDLSIKNTISIDGLVKVAIINDVNLDLIIFNEALKDSFKNGYRQNKNEKKYFDELKYIDCCSFDVILTHLKIVFDGFKISDLSFCVADEYYLFNNEMYIFFNSFNEVNCNNKFYIIKYSYEEMKISQYRSYNGAIYSSPLIFNDRIIVITKDIIEGEYKRLAIDKYLNVLENNSIEIKNKLTEDNNIIIDDQIVSLENILTYDNKYLLGYRYDENFIYLEEYLIDMNAYFEYKILINRTFEQLKILSCFKEDNKIIFTYQLDNTYGYYYLDIINEKYGSLNIFDSNVYYVTLNNIIYLEGNNFKKK